ncbi:hypothetical protein CVU83_00760 [Candidatus Falkowbacteria bacterium HGW-Falkowbacteria-2]|uniref:Uncharacterized protein n=1 Tax=Candidatus Falkowbacteria bacterium HGW-Falkowbacteria-2 TaxID=2013769 RepID=A0A2N2E2Z3_9BACT|nr:MAG: hypothetical protein CVU83_00760 [Candidatus Falkowbacteria bacterium HGW-Falkowbacteria-2]
MFDYLQQFNKLPKELREKVSSPAAMEILSSLEGKYGVSLAMLVMQVMIKQILVKDLTSHFVSEFGLPQDKARSLSSELQERLLFSVSTYLGVRPGPMLSPEDKELEVLMKENGIVLPSQDLISRCRQILLTYRKGVRTKIDARSALERPVEQGGLSLEPSAADRLLRALDRPNTATASAPVVTPTPIPTPAPTHTPAPAAVPSAINDLINKSEASNAYDFKSALAKGEIKPPAVLADKFKQSVNKLDTTHEIAAPTSEFAIVAPEEVKQLMRPSMPYATKATVATEKAETKPATPATPSTPAKQPPIITPNPAPAAPAVEAESATAPKPVAVPVPETKTEKRPEAPAPVRINRPAAAAKAGMWSKLFKGTPTPSSPEVALSATKHLEEAVRAASIQNNNKVRPAASSEHRPKIEDVKLKPKVMGPLEELRYLDLVNFRRLGTNPKEITAKIATKIKLLEKDGYDRMVEGVKAWRQSPVNRLYVRIAHEAVVTGVPLREAVANREAEKKEVLSMDEIEAIVAMNNSLMF